MTVLDAIIQSLSRAGEYNRDDQVAPAVILWPNKDRQWEPVLLVLRERLPHLLTLGSIAKLRTAGGATRFARRHLPPIAKILSFAWPEPR